ncbi:MAG: hypothetical protein ACKVJU_21510 [Verrucomicrobiales bacterium]
MKESAANDPDSIQFFIFGGFFVLAFLWIVIGFAIMLWKRKKSEVVFPKPSDPEVIFLQNLPLHSRMIRQIPDERRPNT